MPKRVYLRVDVDSFVGTRDGVPRLLELFAHYDVRATFFVTIGPDRWGQALARVFFQPGFLSKMLRTRALSSYGLSTCLRGTFLPKAMIGACLHDRYRQIMAGGHELELHCWDHLRWQQKSPQWDAAAAHREIAQACAHFTGFTGRPPAAWASPGWVSSPTVLAELDKLAFAWMSNSRGSGPFIPVVGGAELATVEIPTTLPTLDEEWGSGGIGEGNYAEHLIRQVTSTKVAVHTIHAETEGRGYIAIFERFLAASRTLGWTFQPAGDLAREAIACRAQLPRCLIRYGAIAGRAGQVTLQGEAVKHPMTATASRVMPAHQDSR